MPAFLDSEFQVYRDRGPARTRYSSFRLVRTRTAIVSKLSTLNLELFNDTGRERCHFDMYRELYLSRS